MKRTIPIIIASTAGFVLIVAYFIPYTQNWGEVASIWFDVLAAVAFVLGGGNLLKIHLVKVSTRVSGWGYSLIIVAAFTVTLVVGLLKLGVNPAELYPDRAWSGSYREIGKPFWWLYQYAFVPLTATMFIILLGRTFAGVFLTGWLPEPLSGLRIENLTVDIMRVFNTAGNRAIMIGIALGTASVSLKILLGVDRSFLGSGKD